MSAQHTPVRLTTDEADHDEPYQDIKIKAGEHHTVCTVWIDDAHGRDFNATQRENARRLVACWNACEDEDTAMLEAIVREGTTIRQRHDEALKWKEQYQGELCDVERQRDELLALLKSLLNYDNLGAYERANLRQQARKAIAKIKGKYK